MHDSGAYVTLDNHRRAVLVRALTQYASSLDYSVAETPRARRNMDAAAETARAMALAFERGANAR